MDKDMGLNAAAAKALVNELPAGSEKQSAPHSPTCTHKDDWKSEPCGLRTIGYVEGLNDYCEQHFILAMAAGFKPVRLPSAQMTKLCAGTPRKLVTKCFDGQSCARPTVGCFDKCGRSPESEFLRKYPNVILSSLHNACDQQIAKLERELSAKCAELERVKLELAASGETIRMQLAAISVAACANTRESLKQHEITRENPYWTPAYADTMTAVFREILEREAKEEARETIATLREELAKAREKLHEAIRLLVRYRQETPLGHQPHMIAHEADAAIDAALTVEAKGEEDKP